MSGQSCWGIQYFWVPGVCRKLVSLGGKAAWVRGSEAWLHAAFAVERCQMKAISLSIVLGSSGLFWSSEWRRPSHAKSGEGASEWTSQTGKTFSRSKQNEADWTMDISMMQNPTIQTWSEKFPRGWIIIIRTEIIRFLTLVVSYKKVVYD